MATGIPCFIDPKINVDYAGSILTIRDYYNGECSRDAYNDAKRVANQIRSWANKNTDKVACWSDHKTIEEWEEFYDNNFELFLENSVDMELEECIMDVV
jgi:hypothetical protein